MGLRTRTILGGSSYLSWLYDRAAIKEPEYTGTRKVLSQTMNRGSIRKFLSNCASVYVAIQSHGLSAGVQTHCGCATANEIRNSF